MTTVFVKYKDWLESGHPMIPDSSEEFSTIVEVEKLTDLNRMFSNIVDVKVLEINNEKHGKKLTNNI